MIIYLLENIGHESRNKLLLVDAVPGLVGYSLGSDIQYRFPLHQFHRGKRCDSGSVECYELRPGVVFQRDPDIFTKRIEFGLLCKSFYILK